MSEGRLLKQVVTAIIIGIEKKIDNLYNADISKIDKTTISSFILYILQHILIYLLSLYFQYNFYLRQS